ncbi:MAG: hypothetical protein AAFV53_14580 [Myxococcota bacterium]
MSLVTAALLATLNMADIRWDSIPAAPPLTLNHSADVTDAARETPLHAALQSEGRALLSTVAIAGVVTARVKSADSLRAKAHRKNLRPDQILDRLGIRLILSTTADCYAAMEAIRSRYALIEESFDDYIASPKPNGYRSIHVAVHSPLGVAEFQIRTHEMHEDAEFGSAAHWRYKLATQAV